MCHPHAFSLRSNRNVALHHDRMSIDDETIERFHIRLKEGHGEELSFTDAKYRYLNLLHVFWILSHKIPTDREPPYDLPLPPWL